jgi:hypothetical protein
MFEAFRRAGWLAVLAWTAAAAAASPSASRLLALADRPKNAFPEVVISARVTVTEKGRRSQPAEFDVYRKGEDRTLIVFTRGKQRGRKILTVGERFWIIVPASSHAIPVSANQRLVGGASISDVARLRFSREFSATLRGGPETVGGRECDVLDLRADRPGSSYGSGVLWMDRSEHLPRKLVLNLVSGKPAKEVTFDEYGTDSGKTVLRRMTVRDLLSPDEEKTTLLEYQRYRPARISDDVFTPEGALRFRS